MSTIVIAKNTIASSVLIEDLGIEVDAAGTLNLSELFVLEDITNSDDLKILVANGTLILNDGTSDLTPTEASTLVSLQSVYEDSFEDGESNFITELSSVQIRRTTGLALLTSWQDVTFDTTDIENNISVIEHDNTTPDRILIKETGHYLVYYSFTARTSGATRDCLSRIMRNDLAPIPGADMLQNLYPNETHQQAETAIVHLDAGDFLTMQVSAGSEPIDTMAGYVFHITKLEGISGAKGDKGDQGIQGIQGIQGVPGEATIIDETGNLDESKVTEIENTSSASSTNPYLFLVQLDNRSNNTIPIGINGDMSTHAIMYDGSSWYDLGQFIGIKGDTGDTGPPGEDGLDGQSVKIQKDSVDIMTAVATLNFTGDATITTSPSSKVNVAIAPKQICQVYDNAGGISLNNTTPVSLPFGEQLIVDSYYTHSKTVNNSRITINANGWYKISYSISHTTSNRSNIHSYIRKNGSTKVLISDSYASVGDKDNEYETNNATFLTYLTTGNYIELMCELFGDNTTTLSLANQSWILIEYIRGT
jgi:hypothetical protein